MPVLSYMMRKFGRDDHRYFAEACDNSVLFPRALEYHLVHPVLFDCVRVRSTCRQETADDGRRPLVVAVEQILADEVAAFPVLLNRTVVLIDDDSVLVADGYRTIQLFCPVWYHIRWF